MGRHDLLVRTGTTESQMEHGYTYITGLDPTLRSWTCPPTTFSSSFNNEVKAWYLLPCLGPYSPKDISGS